MPPCGAGPRVRARWRTAGRPSPIRRGPPEAAEPGQEFAAHGRHQMRTGKPVGGDQAVHDRQALGGAAGHGHRDGAVQVDQRRGRDPAEGLVEQHDPGPVGRLDRRGRGVDGGDRGLQGVGAEAVFRGSGQGGQPPMDRRRVPQAAVLVFEQDRGAGRGGAGGETGGGQFAQGQQAVHLRLAGLQRGQDPGQPDRLEGQVGAEQPVARGGRRTLGEDHVEDAEHAAHPFPAFAGRGQFERHLGRRDRLLRPGDAGLDGRHRHQERAGDLLAGQAADHAQGQRHPGLAGEHRVAADEHQRQDVIVDRVGVDLRLGRLAGREQGVLVVEGGPAADRVDRPPPGRRHQPPGRVGRSGARPRRQRLGHRLLGGVLRQPEVAGEPGQRGDDPGRRAPPDRLDVGHQAWPPWGASSSSATRRTSIFEPRTAGIRVAHPTASSWVATSSRK